MLLTHLRDVVSMLKESENSKTKPAENTTPRLPIVKEYPSKPPVYQPEDGYLYTKIYEKNPGIYRSKYQLDPNEILTLKYVYGDKSYPYILHQGREYIFLQLKDTETPDFLQNPENYQTVRVLSDGAYMKKTILTYEKIRQFFTFIEKNCKDFFHDMKINDQHCEATFIDNEKNKHTIEVTADRRCLPTKPENSTNYMFLPKKILHRYDLVNIADVNKNIYDRLKKENWLDNNIGADETTFIMPHLTVPSNLDLMTKHSSVEW